MHYKVLASKGPEVAAAKLGQPWRGLVRHFLVLCGVLCDSGVSCDILCDS